MKQLSNSDHEHQKKTKNPAEILELLQDVLVPLLAAVASGETSSPRRPGRPRLTLQPKEIIEVSPQSNEIVQRQMSEPDLEDKIIDLYAKGLTTKDITNHLKDMHGIELSTSSISGITDKVLPSVKEWQARPLSSQYPILYMDGIWFKVKDSGKIVSKCAYIALGINTQGHKEVLGIWIAENEGAKFWLQVLTEIKNRGVESVLIACVDGLRGFPDAIKTVYPEAVIQVCVIHQVRHTIKYVSHKDRKNFAEDLKNIYAAPSEEAGLQALEETLKKWPQYNFCLKGWEQRWTELAPFFSYPESIRRIMYTTNAIENLNRQFRKVTKTTVIFPHDESLVKLLWLAQRDLAKRWTTSAHNWGQIISQFTILFPDKVKIGN